MLSLHLIAEAGAGAEPCSSCVEFGGGEVSNVRVNVVLYVSSGIMGQSFQGYCQLASQRSVEHCIMKL